MSEFSLPPPIPPPLSDVCPVCGASLQGRPKLCPNCGAVLAQFSTATSCWASLATFVLVMLALGFGGTGACLLLVASSEPGGLNAPSTYKGIFAFIAFCFLAALGCGWAVWALNRRKK